MFSLLSATFTNTLAFYGILNFIITQAPGLKTFVQQIRQSLPYQRCPLLDQSWTWQNVLLQARRGKDYRERDSFRPELFGKRGDCIIETARNRFRLARLIAQEIFWWVSVRSLPNLLGAGANAAFSPTLELRVVSASARKAKGVNLDKASHHFYIFFRPVSRPLKFRIFLTFWTSYKIYKIRLRRVLFRNM